MWCYIMTMQEKLFLLKIYYFSTICHSAVFKKNGQHLENKDSFLLDSQLVSHAFLLWTQIPSAVR